MHVGLFLDLCYVHVCDQISVEDGSSPINTLYNRLLTAGPIRESVNAPFLFADFYTISPHPMRAYTPPK